MIVRYFVDTSFDFDLQHLGGRVLAVIKLRFQKTTLNKSIGVESQHRGDQFWSTLNSSYSLINKVNFPCCALPQFVESVLLFYLSPRDLPQSKTYRIITTIQMLQYKCNTNKIRNFMVRPGLKKIHEMMCISYFAIN